MRDGFHHVGARHKHVGRALGHEDEIGQRRRIHGAAGARAQDQRELRHHPTRFHVAVEDVGISAEAHHTLLDARTAAVVEPDHGGAVVQRHLHDLANLLGVGLGQRAAEHREILGEHVDEPAVDLAVAGHHAVAQELLLVQAKIRGPVRHQLSQFLKRAGVQQQLQALPRRQLALAVLGLHPSFTAALQGFGAHRFEAFCGVLHDAKLREFRRLTAGFGAPRTADSSCASPT